VRATALIADPPGDANRKTQFEVACELLVRAGETVRDARRQPGAMLLQDAEEISVRSALMQENRLVNAGRKLELLVKGPPLRCVRGQVAIIIKPALANCDHLRQPGERTELAQQFAVELECVVRMNTGGREELARPAARKFDRGTGTRAARAGHDHLRDARRGGARDDCVAVGIEALMRQINPDIDERRCGPRGGVRGACAIVRHARGSFYRRAKHPMRSKNKCPSGRASSLAAAAGWSLVAALGVSASDTRAPAADTNWQDVESRIQYGYYTEDLRSLGNVIELLAPAQSPAALSSYYAGLANYRLTLLSVPVDKGRARQSAERCVTSLERALQAQKDFAEAMAVQSACLEMLASLQPLKAPFASSRSGTQIEKARHLAPRNPRVLLLGAVEDYERPKSSEADKARAASEFRHAADIFEAERQEAQHVPGWGAADAYVYLARCYLDLGRALQARDALERALLMAPEFAQAKRLMAKITAG
jgi:hypothetical protein